MKMVPEPSLPYSSSKKRTSSLTYVILAVNIIPLLIMSFGIFYLDKYKSNLIAATFVHLKESTRLIALMLEEDPKNLEVFKRGWPDNKSLYYIDENGKLIESIGTFSQSDKPLEKKNPEVLNLTETFAELFIYLNPLSTTLPLFPVSDLHELSKRLPELQAAFHDFSGLAAWAYNDTFLLTATMPVRGANNKKQAILVIMTGNEITKAINEVRSDIIQAFLVVIILTFLLSVYLSSFIAIPLKKLGRAAEDIRRGKRNLTDLPDMSYRRDEIGELSVILRQMVLALDTRIDAIQNFAADVAHEIKNPITSIRSAIETALVVKDRDKQEGLLRIMEKDVHRLDRLISDISRHSRLDSELARDSYHVIDLKDVLVDIADLWSDPEHRHNKDAVNSAKKGSVIDVSFSDEDCRVLCKGNSLGQVFQNLISNALSFHKGNEPVKIQVTTKQTKVVVTVEDQGPGIQEGQQTKIFERFYSDRPDDHDKTRNSGLGLAIAKQIIEAHGGRISAENIYDEHKSKVLGARFIVVLNRYTD